jgi:hypothetical protein
MKRLLWLPALLHFFVDFFSVYALMAFHFDGNLAFILILAYDALAFLPQPLLGALLEKSHHLAYWGSLGCLLTMLGALIPEGITAIIFFGLGNALFHVSEGKLVLDKSEKSAPLGIFISFGSLGLGLALSYENIILFFALLIAFLLLSIANCFLPYEMVKKPLLFSEEKTSKTMLFPLILIVLGVFFRGFFGQYTAYHFDPALANSALWFAGAIFLGKFLGGFLLDFAGSWPLILFSSLLSFICYFFPSIVSVSLLGVVGVNLLMALTMDFMRRATPANTAFGFGLLAAFLLLGYESGAFLKSGVDFQVYLAPLLMGLNCLSLVLTDYLLKKGGRSSSSYLALRKETEPCH